MKICNKLSIGFFLLVVLFLFSCTSTPKNSVLDIYRITKYEILGQDCLGDDIFLCVIQNGNELAFLTYTSLEEMNDPFKNVKSHVILSNFNSKTNVYESVRENGQDAIDTVGKVTITRNRIRLEILKLAIIIDEKPLKLSEREATSL